MRAYLSAEGIVVMSLALLLSTRLSGMTAGVISLVLFFLAWIGGIAGAIGEVFGSTAIYNAGTISQLLLPTDALWRGSVYELEPVLYRDCARRHHRTCRQSVLRPVATVDGLSHLGGVLGGADRLAHRLEPAPPRGLIPPNSRSAHSGRTWS